jgi:hypothetical protein
MDSGLALRSDLPPQASWRRADPQSVCLAPTAGMTHRLDFSG